METQANISNSYPKMFFKQITTRFKKGFKSPQENNSPHKESEKKTRVFIVDDDPLFLKAIELSISSNIGSLTIDTFQTGEACLQKMKLKPAVVILDYYLNSEVPYAWNGMNILNHIKKISPKTKVIMISSQDSLNVAIDCIQKGAHDYVSKSRASLNRINGILKNIVENIETRSGFFEVCQLIVLIIILAIIASVIVG